MFWRPLRANFRSKGNAKIMKTLFVVISLRIPKEIHLKLVEQAKKEDRTVSSVACYLLERGLESTSSDNAHHWLSTTDGA